MKSAKNKDIVGYNVYRTSVSGKAHVKINKELIPCTSYNDTGLPDGKKFYYRITAVDVNGLESQPSQEVSGTTSAFFLQEILGGQWWMILLIVSTVLVTVILLCERRRRKRQFEKQMKLLLQLHGYMNKL